MKYFITLSLFLFTCSIFSQVDASVNVFKDKDTNAVENIYYTDYTDQFLLKFTNSIKWSKLDIINLNDNKALKLAPAGSLDLGLAFNYKWLGLGFTVGLPSGALSDSTKGKTTRFDMQMSIYSKWFVIDAFYQKYKGFYLSNPTDFSTQDTTAGANDFATSTILPQLPEMENYSLGFSAYYILNHKKFSYRAAYVRNEVQNKSAGSLLFGPYFNIDAASSPGGFVPQGLPMSVVDSFPLGNFSSISYGLSIGYTYSVVIVKKVFMNFSIIPGFGYQKIRADSFGGPLKKTGASGRMAYRFAFGYEQRSFLIGLTLQGAAGFNEVDDYQFSPGLGLLNLFVGKRFDLKKMKKNRADKKALKAKAQ